MKFSKICLVAMLVMVGARMSTSAVLGVTSVPSPCASSPCGPAYTCMTIGNSFECIPIECPWGEVLNTDSGECYCPDGRKVDEDYYGICVDIEEENARENEDAERENE